jgi:gamma-glutamylcyclotransferase
MLRRVMQTLYFAYGSNLARRRMRERAPGARIHGRARLEGWCLVADKPGRDGSAKVNLVRESESHVWGAVWTLREEDLRVLDHFEGGYARAAVTVTADWGPLAASTYVSTLRSAQTGLERGYKELLLEGAREQGLPPEWIAFLDSLA